MNKLIKVDRVCSVDEAKAVEELGAGLIGVPLDPDPRFADRRTVAMELAAEIGASLRTAGLVAMVDLREDPFDGIRRARAIGARLVQPLGGAIPEPQVRAALREAGISIVYAGIEAAHDDDPAWILSRYTTVDDLQAAFFQVDVLPEYRNAWQVLRDESPAYDDELQIDDLNQLARGHDLVAVLDYTPQNVAQIVAALPAFRGVALTLADHATRTDVHFTGYAQALEVLRALRGGG